MFPPHLPPPTSDLRRHRQWQGIKNILVSTLFGLLSGLAGAAVLLGWIWPLSGGSDGLFLQRNSVILSRDQLQIRAEQKVSGQVYHLYQRSTLIGKARYFSESDKIGDSLMTVTSGWVLAYVPNFDGRTKDWVALAEDGSLYSINRVLQDKRAELLFLKLQPLNQPSASATEAQFKVVTFGDEPEQFDEVFVYQDGRWLNTSIISRSGGSLSSHLETAPDFVFNVNDSFKDGSPVIDAQGNVLGFISGRTSFLALVHVDFFLSGIEEKKQILYPSLGLEGWYTSEKTLVLNDEKMTGFIVGKVLGNKQYFQKNDILLEVNGRLADEANVWNALQGSKVRVSVWRSGKIIEVQVPVLQI